MIPSAITSSRESSAPPADAQVEYERRLRERREADARLEAFDSRFSTARGIVFLCGIALFVLAVRSVVSPGLILIPIVLFIGLLVWHGTIRRRLERNRDAVRLYEISLERLADRWGGVGASGERYRDEHHVYSSDLDLFGDGSLFQLLCRARTRLGEDTLADWLREAAAPKTVRERQAAVEELRNRLDLREELALLDAEVHDDLDQSLLLEWAEAPAFSVSAWRRVLAAVLSVLIVLGLVAWLGFGRQLSFVMLPLLCQVLFLATFAKAIRTVVQTMDIGGAGLRILAQVLTVIERERPICDLLKQIRGRLDSDGRPPSESIHLLHRRIQALHNSVANQFFAPVAFVLGLPVHLVHSIETWRSQFGSRIPHWLQSVGEFETLSTFAGHAYEHPADPFPEIVQDGPVVEFVQAGHPLLPRANCVRNDTALGGELRLILISGSNMSGKSTLLRTVGTNIVLALAGAPVRAESCRLSCVQLGSAMRVHDSLQDGESLFYAVVSRLKTIVDLAAKDRPLLFLLDEILQGTNSHDRRVGAEGVIRKLVADGAIGFVTTHDLALTKIVDSLGGQAHNRHFEDHLEDGEMTFDYVIRPGVVKKSNALELMRMMGLDV